MKKAWKILCVVLCLMMLGGCGKETEYDIEEFAKICSGMTKEIVKEYKYMTKEEIKEQYKQIHEKCAKKFGLTVGQEITVSGCFSDYEDSDTFFLRAKGDIKYLDVITAKFKKEDIKNYLIEDEVIKIRGQFYTGEEDALDLYNCELISPDISER